jgi:ubiquinone/menaquinone biosynthesis C-methylase UbiE
MPFDPEKYFEGKYVEKLGEHSKAERANFENQYNNLADNYADMKYEKNPQQKDLGIFLKLLKPKSKILDLGCGAGQDAGYLAEAGMEVLGLDISKEMIAEAKKRNPTIIFSVGDFLLFNFVDDKFDAVWCSTVFHHIPSDQNEVFIKKIQRILRPGGLLYISTGVGGSESEGWTDAEWETKNEKIPTKMYNKIMKSEKFENLIKKFSFEITQKSVDDSNGYEFIFAINRK